MIGKTEFSVTARLNADGEASLRVTGSCPYGERTASVSIDITEEKILKSLASVLGKVVAGVRDELNQEATSAAAEALVCATRRGEKI